MKTLTLDAFKETIKANKEFKDELINRKDIVDLQHGIMRIYPEHLNKYLEEYMCKDFNDLENTLYHYYGIFLTMFEDYE